MKTLIAAILMAIPTCLAAQAPAAFDVEPLAVASGGFFAVSVPDLEASVKWYSDKLGLKVAVRGGRSGKLAGLAIMEGGGLVIELLQNDDATSRPGNPELVHGFIKGGIMVDDMDKAVAMLRAREIPIVMGPFPARETRRANVAFRDNAGNLIFRIGPYAKCQ